MSYLRSHIDFYIRHFLQYPYMQLHKSVRHLTSSTYYDRENPLLNVKLQYLTTIALYIAPTCDTWVMSPKTGVKVVVLGISPKIGLLLLSGFRFYYRFEINLKSVYSWYPFKGCLTFYLNCSQLYSVHRMVIYFMCYGISCLTNRFMLPGDDEVHAP